MSLALSSCSKSGLSGPGEPEIASTTWPPGTGPVRAMGSGRLTLQPVIRKRTARASGPPLRCGRRTLLVSLEPDVSDGRDEEDSGQHPGRVVELALQAAPGAVAPTEPAVSASNGPPQSGRFRRLEQHSRHQEDGNGHFHDDERVANLVHGRSESSEKGAGGAPPLTPFPPPYLAAARAAARRWLMALQFAVFHQAAT